MAYTVQEAYFKTVEEADKMGSDLLTLPIFLMMFKSITTEFIGARAAEAEKTQQITTDIQDLVVPTARPLTPDPDFAATHLASFPADYFERIRCNVRYTNGLLARQPQIIRHGELDNAEINPDMKPSKDYPLILQYANYFQIKTNIGSFETIQPQDLILTYIKRPTFGVAISDIVVNLNDTIVQFLISRTADNFKNLKGDPRATSNIQWTETFRKK